MKTIIKIQVFIFLLGFGLLQASVSEVPAKQLLGINKAVQDLEQSRQQQQQSRQLFVSANKVRKQLKSLRAKNRQLEGQKANSSDEKISELVAELETMQQQGAALRNQSEQLRREAQDSFTKGFIDLWGGWVANTGALTMDESVESFFAHNTRVRSVHKNMPSPSLDITSTNRRNDMSLQVPGLVSQNAPPNLDISAFKFSRKEKLFAHIEVHSEHEQKKTGSASNNVAAVPLNQIHQWRLLVTDLNGKPVENIQFIVEGHMPGHVHGLPTAPRVMGEIQPGVYLVDGLKFQMKGWWVMKFLLVDKKFNNKTQADFFTFNLVL